MAQIVKFDTDFYDDGAVKFAAGSYHPLNSQTQSLVNTGFAELVDTDTTDDLVPALQALADIAQNAADEAQAQAAVLATAADDAKKLVETAIANGGKKTAPAQIVEPDEAAAAEVLALSQLKLSTTQPAVIDLPNGGKADSAEVSRDVFQASALTAIAWNDLPDEDREAMISAEVSKLIEANPAA